MNIFTALVISFITAALLIITGTVAYQLTGVEAFGISVAFGLAVGGAATLIGYVHYCVDAR